jgi:hypothetical protein
MHDAAFCWKGRIVVNSVWALRCVVCPQHALCTACRNGADWRGDLRSSVSAGSAGSGDPRQAVGHRSGTGWLTFVIFLAPSNGPWARASLWGVWRNVVSARLVLRIAMLAIALGQGLGARDLGLAVDRVLKERVGGNGSRLWNICTCANAGPMSNGRQRRKEGIKLTRRHRGTGHKGVMAWLCPVLADYRIFKERMGGRSR